MGNNNINTCKKNKKMKLPKTTPDQPYIEFSFSKTGVLTLRATSSWWGGIRSGFFAGNGSMGNTCKPKDLNKYIKAFKDRKIKEVEKEITELQKKLQQIKNQTAQITEI